MSDETNTTPKTPDNIVSPDFNGTGAETVSYPTEAQQAAEPAAEEPAQEPQVHSIHDAVAHVISNIDLNKVSHHDVVHDLFRSSQDYAFKLMLAAKLFEQMLIRDSAGLKGEAFDLLRHADEAVVNEVHAILKAKVAIPTPTEVLPADDQAVS